MLKKIHSSVICNSSKLETIKIPTSGNIDKQVDLLTELYNLKELSTTMQVTIGEVN